MRRPSAVLVIALTLASLIVAIPGSVSGKIPQIESGDPDRAGEDLEALLESSALARRDVEFTGTGLTECPQAGFKPEHQPRPLDDQRNDDKAEQVGNAGNEQRANQEFSCFPQDETSIAVNPRNPRNAVGGANDYRMGWGTSGFYSTTDNGNNWYTGIIPFPSLPSGDNLDGGGDPAITFDRAGIAYYVDINFNRTDDTNGIFVSRSTNGGFTWSRPCVAIRAIASTPEQARCGGPGDVRKPGDGTVTFQQDNDQTANSSVPFNDKEYVAAGPRPAGVQPQCFPPNPRQPTDPATVACASGTVGVDRIHVTWTKFECTIAVCTHAEIYYSFSDDQGRSWSPERPISGNAPFCTGGTPPPVDRCDFNQFSTPTVNPVTGHLYVAFENYNTPDENQYLLVRSPDGGQTFQGPFFITPVFDVNYPRSGRTRPDCAPRGQQGGRPVLTNSCFRVNSGGNVVVDRRGGDFADDLYLVMSDNRNGTPVSSNTDVFLFASKDGGTTWIGPTRVNNDPSRQPNNRTCTNASDPNCAPPAGFGNDQWFPWVDISPRGDLNVNFYDRRLDTNSTASEWPTSRQRPGNYLVWRFGAVCSITTTGTVTATTTTIPASASPCIAPTASVIPQPTAPIDPAATPILPAQTVFPLKNFTLSDVPNNWDYSFRAGIFAGDYDVVAIGPDNTAWAIWTDARNGRSSRNQAGRNPTCEQSDAFVELYGSQSGGTIKTAQQTDSLFLVTPCPLGMQDPGNIPGP
ncbi:MAG: sialidase family protein [Candidatus Limnocylindria bacterium]